nr:PorT family protein [Bacteroidota bacterium]
MKIILRFFVVLFLFAASGEIQAQRVMGAVIGGVNATNVQGDDVYGFKKFGMNVGVAAIVPVAEKWSFSLETTYSQKGSYHKKGGRGMDYSIKHDYNQYKLVLNYLEVPVLFHFEDKRYLKAGTGFSYGRLIEVKEWEDGYRVATTTLNDGPYDLNDFSWLFDVQVPIYRQLKINARYSFSMIKIREREYENVSPTEEKVRKQYNQVLSLRVVWIFNEKASRENRLQGGF